LRKTGIDGIHFFFNVKEKLKKETPEVAKRVDERVISDFQRYLRGCEG